MPSIAQIIFALLFVLSLIGLFSYIMKRYAVDRNLLKGGQKRRLKFEEALYLDSRRKVVLISKDDEEITLLLSPNGETVISKTKTAGTSLPLEPKPIIKKKKKKKLKE